MFRRCRYRLLGWYDAVCCFGRVLPAFLLQQCGFGLRVASWFHGIELVLGTTEAGFELAQVDGVNLIWEGFPHIEEGLEGLEFLDFTEECILVEPVPFGTIFADALAAAHRFGCALSSSVHSRMILRCSASCLKCW